MALRNWFRSLRKTPSHAVSRRSHSRLGIQLLEAREVPAVDFASALEFGNNVGSNEAYDVAADAAGNSYMTGYFSGTVDFDTANSRPGDTDILTSVGNVDTYVAKYGVDNTLVWVARMGGIERDRGRAIDVDSVGNVFVTGEFSGEATYGSTTLTSLGTATDGFVAKLSPAGTIQWAKRWGLNTSTGLGENGSGIETDAAGNAYVVGERWTNNGLATFGYDVLKFDTLGTQVWAKFIPSKSNPASSDIVVDPSGNVFVTGSFYGTVDFDPNAGVKNVSAGTGSYSAFVLKLTTAGNFSWVTPFVSQSQAINGVMTYGASNPNAIALDGNGNVFVAGFYFNKVDFNPGSGTTNLPHTNNDAWGFVTKLNAGGNLVWAKSIESQGDIFLRGLATDAAGNVYVTGIFKGSIDLDPGAGMFTRQSTSQNDGITASEDIFLIKLNSSGNLAWADTFGGHSNDASWGLAVDPTGTIHLAGGYAGTVDFDPDPLDTFDLSNTTSSRHTFLLRLRQI